MTDNQAHSESHQAGVARENDPTTPAFGQENAQFYGLDGTEHEAG
jgi:hypothetical protein